jgi:hypothetical protein
MNQPKFPIMDPKKPLYVHMHNLQEYYAQSKEPKYNLILEFINKFYGSKFTSLKEFKDVDVDKIDKKKFKDLLEVDDYKYKLEGELSIEIDEIDLDIVKILSDCMKSIDYTLLKKKVEFEKKDKKTGEKKTVRKIYITVLSIPKK